MCSCDIATEDAACPQLDYQQSDGGLSGCDSSGTQERQMSAAITLSPDGITGCDCRGSLLQRKTRQLLDVLRLLRTSADGQGSLLFSMQRMRLFPRLRFSRLTVRVGTSSEWLCSGQLLEKTSDFLKVLQLIRNRPLSGDFVLSGQCHQFETVNLRK